MRVFNMALFRPLPRLGALLGLAMAAFCPTAFLPTGAFAIDPFAPDAYGTYQANVENGKVLFGAAGCGACHGSGDNTELLSGGMEMQTAIGKFFAPNISAHPNGIGGWSNADFLNAVMAGVDKEGDNLYPVMPYTSYGGMKPEDVLDIKAYIETLPQSDAASKEHEIAFPFSRQTTITLWKRSHFTVPAYQAREETQMERGRYLVENVGGCGDCHTPRTATYGLDLERAYEGEKGLTGAVAPDITKARMGGLASHEVFTKGLIEEGKKLSGSPLADPVMRHIAKGLSALPEEDRQAMYAFLADREVKVTPVETSATPVCSEATAETALTAGGGSAEFASAADAFIGKYCRNCHGPGESSQGSFPSGELSSIAANPAFVTPGDASKSLLYTSVTSGRMPLGKRPDDAEVQSLANWINSLNQSAMPTAVSAGQTKRSRPMLKYLDFVDLALRDISQVDEQDQPFMRYFSYRDQYNGMMSCETHETFLKRMKVLAGGFKKLLNSLSYGPELVIPEEVEGSDGLLVRIDLRDLQWSEDDYNFLINEYFYGVDPASNSQLHALSKATQTQLPIMRVDWFMSNGARPKVYNRLMKLPTNIIELEKRFGVDVAQNIERRRIVRAGFADGSSGVSDHNRMLERHDMPFGGYYWKSYDFAGDVGRQVLKRFPAGPDGVRLKAGLEPFEHDGGEMIFSLPNGMQGYYLSTNKGDQLDIGPTAIVSFRKRPIGKGVEIVNARSCFDCHFDGILSKRDQLREHIQTSTLFSKDQQDELLAVYVPQEKLNEVYKRDTERFVSALDRLGITEATAGGGKTSLKAPGGAEIFTYFADKYEDELNFEQLAAEFDMTPEEFASDIRRVADVNALRIGLDWVATLEAGSTIPRVEVEEQFALMLEPLRQFKPLKRGVNHEAAAAETAHTQPTTDNAGDQVQTAYAVPAYKQDDKAQADKVKLAVHVASTSAKVGDYLSFELSTNHACELQVVYVEDTGTVEIIPDVMIGNTTLNPGERRLIPQAGTGNLTFDTPSAGETLIAFCRIGGLGDQKLTPEKAQQLAAKSKQPLSRGLAINLAKQAEQDNGTSGLQMVTFEIK
ncbi:c-type cytochrome [Shinella oryzae]|uniref:c-type cytochrome n=1 Tax=Shinella oryzae TaxID=2871820 RepID=UPI001FF27967|nr:c-type cytochrome [Shinella oryzae]UPA25953.1 c-type cytochrome [Shinella oryzae]